MVFSRKMLLAPLVLGSAMALPLTSFATTYTSIVTGVDSGPNNPGELQVIGLGTDGFAYLPVWQDTNGNWTQAGILPGQGVPFSALVTGISVGGLGKLQVIGLGANDGHAYVAAFQDTGGNWYPGGPMPNQTVAYSQLVTGVGNSTAPLQLIGLGASDGFAYLAAYQDTGGTWHSGGVLPGQTRRFSFLVAGTGNGGHLQVIGKGASDGILYLAAWQDSNGTWHASGSLPNSSPGFSALAPANGNKGNLNVIGLASGNGELYLPDWQESSNGSWHGAGILPNQSTAFSQLVVGVGNSGFLQVGGLGASDHLLHMTDFQNGNGTWVGIGSIPTFNATVTQVVTGRGNSGHLQILGLGTNNHIELITWQDGSGTWHAGNDLTP